MKRILPLVLTVLLLPALLAVPVMADDGAPWLNLLEFYTADNSGTNYVALDKSGDVVKYDLPGDTMVAQIDMILYSRVAITSVNISRNGTDYTSATVQSLGNNLYRIYMNSSTVFYGVWVQIYYDGTSTNSVQFQSLRIATMSFARQSLNVAGNVHNYSLGGDTRFIYHDSAGNYNFAEWINSQNALNDYGWGIVVEIEDYSRYDYLEIMFNIRTESIETIQCLSNGQIVPLEVEYINNSGNNTQKRYAVCVRIDLTELTRTRTAKPELTITGTGLVNLSSEASIPYAYGYYQASTVSPLAVWFGNLQKWLSDGFDSIVNALGGNNDSSQVTGNINSAIGELEGVQSVMDSVSRPDLNAIDFNVSGMLDTSAVAVYGNIFSTLIGNQYMTNILMIAFVLAAASFLLFGRR